MDCKKLTSITIPSSVTSLGDGCFYDCTNLTPIDIPSSVTSLGSSCFYNCEKLTSMYVKSVPPPSVSSSTFDYFRRRICTLYVPIGAAVVYENTAYWKEFTTIKEMDFATGINSVYTPSQLVTVYDLDGRVVKRNADPTRLPETLPRGIYIVDGKKYVVR